MVYLIKQSSPFISSFICLCFFFLVFFLFACDSPEVKQIEVNVPERLQVPEEMVYIPAGEFIMGHAEEPRTKLGQKVSSKAYLIDRYEVSREQYQKFQRKYTFPPKSGLYPVTHVSYVESLEYCQALDKRLPT